MKRHIITIISNFNKLSKFKFFTVLGQQGEEYVQNLMSGDTFYKFDLTAKTANKSDFIVKISKSKFTGVLEVKNYADHHKVKLDDRKKFLNDLDNNSEYNYGILVSLRGGFPHNWEDELMVI